MSKTLREIVLISTIAGMTLAGAVGCGMAPRAPPVHLGLILSNMGRDLMDLNAKKKNGEISEDDFNKKIEEYMKDREMREKRQGFYGEEARREELECLRTGKIDWHDYTLGRELLRKKAPELYIEYRKKMLILEDSDYKK